MDKNIREDSGHSCPCDESRTHEDIRRIHRLIPARCKLSLFHLYLHNARLQTSP